MIGAKDLAVDGGGGDFIRNPVGYDKVVDAPSGVVLPGVEAVAPPTVDTGGIRVEVSEGIRKACIQKLCEAVPLFIGETGVSTIGGGILQIDLLVGNIQITATPIYAETLGSDHCPVGLEIDI